MNLFSKSLFSLFLFCLMGRAFSFELGVGTHLAFYPNSEDYYIKLIKDYGFTSMRDEVSWQQIEQSPKNFSVPEIITKTDEAFYSSKYDDVSMILILSYGNKLYTKGGYPSNSSDIEKFSDYVSWIVSRYKDKVKYYEIWNEWLNGTGVTNKKKARPSDEIFLSLVKSASVAIKNSDPNAIVMTGSLNPLKAYERQWLYQLVNNGLMNYVDAISIHPYSFQFSGSALQTPEGNLMEIDKFEQELKRITGKEIPLYITEIGYPTTYAGGGFLPEKAGIDTLKYSLLAKAKPYIKGVWWYDLIDDGVSYRNREHHFGLLEINHSPKPAATYLKEFSRLIKNANISIITESVSGIIKISISNGYNDINIEWDNSSPNSDAIFIEQLRHAKKELGY